MTFGQIFLGVLGNVCPRCNEGPVFSGVMKMHEKCSNCGFKYEREPGYFLGAMSFSYFIGFIAILPLFLFLLFKEYSFFLLIALPGVQLLMIAPFLLRFSRLIWLYLDYRMSPE